MSRSAFFRQSGWMMIATVGGGALMFLVHKVAGRMPKEEYGVFTTLLQLVAQLGIPAVGLQGIIAQQAAGSMTESHERQLAGVFRGVLRGTLVLWLVVAAGALCFQKQIVAALQIVNPAALWMTLLIGLVTLWRPLVLGVLQGRQNFLWLGGIAAIEAVGRFGGVCLIVGLLHFCAAGAMSAVLAGMVLTVGIGAWLVRDCLCVKADPVDWRRWLGRVVPLTLGLGVCTFMLSADMLFVQNFFPAKETGYYAAAGMIGRALVYFTGPLSVVMFPKIARGAARGEKTDALALALGATALAGGMAAVACTLFPALPLYVIYDKSFIEIASPMVPWFAWCMLPLTLSTVLINSLMAHGKFASVPWLVLVAVGYGVALQRYHGSFKQVIQVLGIFGVLLFCVCAWFTWVRSRNALKTSSCSSVP